jgi:hypothetical protein
MVKCFNLLDFIISYNEKKSLMTLTPGLAMMTAVYSGPGKRNEQVKVQYYKSFYVCNLRMFIKC